jgi:hypothetical protein
MSVNLACRGPVSRAPGFRSSRSGASLPLVLALAAFLAACGGGGGSSFQGGGAKLLAVYDFAVTNPGGGPGSLVRTLVTPELPDDIYALDAGTGTVQGQYSLATGDFTVADSTTFNVDWSGNGPVPAEFSVGVTAELAQAFGDFQPRDGALAVEYAVNPAGDTRIALNDGEPVLLTPAAFNQLDEPGTVAPDWQRVAARSSRVLVDLLDQVRGMAGFVEDVLDGQLDNDQSFRCDSIPGIPPGGVLNPGTLDRSNLGGDDYLVDATDCFSQAGTTGFLSNGTITVQNLDSEEDEDDVVIRAGVDRILVDTAVERLSESGGNWNFTGDATFYGGGFSLEFTAPSP